MGTWSTSITGNDTAEDLRSEYTCAFYKFEPDEGVRLLDEYVKQELSIDEECDEEEWCNYVYSLANFMWKKGILTKEIRERALNMIDSGYGLEIWAESGDKVLNERKKALEKFREKITSPQPPKKKIKPQAHMENIFRDGELIALQLMTSDKNYTSEANSVRPLSNEEFKAYNGKYILIQKIRCHSSWHSYILPEINDYWAVFRLFDGVYDEIPEINDISVLKDASFIATPITPLFECESNMFYFKKRKYKIIGYFPDEIKKYENVQRTAYVFWSVNREWTNPESDLIAAMGKELIIEEYKSDIEAFLPEAYMACKFYSIDYHISNEENQRIQEEDEKQIKEHIELTKNNGGRFFTLKFGSVIGFGSVTGSKIDDFFIFNNYRRNGFSDILLKHLMNIAGKDAHMDIPDRRIRKKLISLCERVGLKYNLL